MRILLTGASGFLGSRLAAALHAEMYVVVWADHPPGPRHDPRFAWTPVDFTQDFDADVWLPRLAGVDIVINAYGIVRETAQQSFDDAYRRAPCALFDACVRSDVQLVVQMSSLGADERAASPGRISQRRADDYLTGLPVPSVIVQPALVYGEGGALARRLTMWASLPLLPLPGIGQQRLQPLHVDDLVTAIVGLLTHTVASGTRVPLAGPHPVSFRDLLTTLRTGLDLPSARTVSLPLGLVQATVSVARRLRIGGLAPEMLAMLLRDTTADAEPAQYLLGRPARPVAAFITPDAAPAIRLRAKLDWLLPMLRLGLALVWLINGAASLLLYPVPGSLALLDRIGMTGDVALIMLYGAALLQLGLGAATLVMLHRRWLWWLQLGLLGVCTLIFTLLLPRLWLQPSGPLLLYLLMAAVLWLLLELEDQRPAGPPNDASNQ